MFDPTDELDPYHDDNPGGYTERDFHDQFMPLEEIDQLEMALFHKFKKIIPANCNITFMLCNDTEFERDEKRNSFGMGGLTATGYYHDNAVLHVKFQSELLPDPDDEDGAELAELIYLCPTSADDKEFNLSCRKPALATEVKDLCDNYDTIFATCFDKPGLNFEKIPSSSICMHVHDMDFPTQKNDFLTGLKLFEDTVDFLVDTHADLKGQCAAQRFVY